MIKTAMHKQGYNVVSPEYNTPTVIKCMGECESRQNLWATLDVPTWVQAIEIHLCR